MRICLEPGCSARVPRGRCDRHRRTSERARGSRHERGYDAAWTRLRNWFMAQPENQLCVVCLREGRYERATDADHVIPFKGRDDPKRLDVSNLQPACARHNRSRRGPA